MNFKKVKLIKRFISGATPHTVAAILNVPLATVYDLENVRDLPSKDQTNAIKSGRQFLI